jgi:hypothetical protein
MEAPDAGLEARPLDPQEVEGLSIDDVKAAATIHEHLGEASVGDDGIDNKRVDPWIWDVIGVIIMVKSDGNLRPVKEVGGRRLHGEDLSPFLLALARRETCRGPSIDHEAVVDLEEPLILVVTLGIFLLFIPLDAYALKVPMELVAVFEVVVHGSLVVGTRLLEHFVEDAPTGGPSRLLAFSGSNKLIGRGLELSLLVLLFLPVVSLGAPAGARGIINLVLSLVLIAAKDGTNRLFAGGEVVDDVHQTVGSERSVMAKLSDQLFAGGAREEGHNHVGVGDVWKLSALSGETPDVISKRFTWLLLAASEVP